jgi:hypothetical protein
MKVLTVLVVLACVVVGLLYLRKVAPPVGLILGMVGAGLVCFALYYWLALKE